MAIATNRVTATNDLDLKDRLVAINRVTKVTKGGRTFTFAAIVVVGNEDGIVGYGMGRASEVPAAIAKGVEAAKKNLIRVPIHNGTIPHACGTRQCRRYRCFGKEPGVNESTQSRQGYHRSTR